MDRFLMKFIVAVALCVTGCASEKKFACGEVDPVVTKYAMQEGLRLPVLTDSRKRFVESADFILQSAEYRKNSEAPGFPDNTAIRRYKTPNKSKYYPAFRDYEFYSGYLASVTELYSADTYWYDKEGTKVSFNYINQIQYYENKTIKTYVTFLVGQYLNDDFEVGTTYYFSDSGELLYSFDLDRLYVTNLKGLYKILYQGEGDYAYKNIRYIDRLYDAKKALWIIEYNNDMTLLIDDKTKKKYYFKWRDIEDLKDKVVAIYPDFNVSYKSEMDEKYGMLFRYHIKNHIP